MLAVERRRRTRRSPAEARRRGVLPASRSRSWLRRGVAFRYVNEAANAVLLGGGAARRGQRRGRRLGSPWDVYPTSEQGFRSRMRRAVEEAAGDVRSSTGHRRWSEVRCFPMPDGGVAVAWRDVTARRADETAQCLPGDGISRRRSPRDALAESAPRRAAPRRLVRGGPRRGRRPPRARRGRARRPEQDARCTRAAAASDRPAATRGIAPSCARDGRVLRSSRRAARRVRRRPEADGRGRSLAPALRNRASSRRPHARRADARRRGVGPPLRRENCASPRSSRGAPRSRWRTRACTAHRSSPASRRGGERSKSEFLASMSPSCARAQRNAGYVICCCTACEAS